MRIAELNRWEEFEPKINEIISEFGSHGSNGIMDKIRILYRGQGNSKWGLETTLERFTYHQYSIEDYLSISLRIAHEIESFTEKDFRLPTEEQIIKELNQISSMFFLHIPVYDYWVHLRHNGFPSLLLDWTYSPYIAAFFAFSDDIQADKCAVYVYIEWPEGVKNCSGLDPRINVLGPDIKTHKRHFLQQSWYSIAVQGSSNVPGEENYSSQTIISHEEIFKSSHKNQDIIFKITLPRTERIKVLNQLNKYNINSFSLFQSEESLLKTIAFKEFQLHNFEV